MNVIIGINHPKQIYMFRNLYFNLEEKGHKVLILVVHKEICIDLLKAFQMDYVQIGENRTGVVGKFLSMFSSIFRTILISSKFKPDLYIGQALVHLGVSRLVYRKKFIIFEDTEHAYLPHLLANPLSDCIVTPVFFTKPLGKKQIKIDGCYELAYLRPEYFIPDPKVLVALGLTEDESFTIVRFVNWEANHDIGHNGMSQIEKIKLIDVLLNYGKVFISSEGPLPTQLEKFRVQINPAHMHSVMYYASLFFGESASMAAESSVLGTPSIFIDDTGRGYTDEIARYGVLYHFTESRSQISKAIELAGSLLANPQQNWHEDAQKFIKDKIDVASFMTWIALKYLESPKIGLREIRLDMEK